MKLSTKIAATLGRPPAGAGRDAREVLLSSATELFAVHGVAATTFAMIAKHAELTPAMVHYYFKDRDQLCDAVVEERLLRIVSLVWDPLEPGAKIEDMIRGVIGRLLEQIEKKPWVPSLWIREILNEGGLLRERMLSQAPFDKAQFLASAIAEGQADGSLNPEVDPLLTVSSTIGLVMLNMAASEIWAQVIHRKPLSTLAMQRHITGLLFDGLRNKRPARPKTVSRSKNT